MASLIARCAVTVAASAALVMPGPPAADGASHAAARHRIGNRCLIGTWRDGRSRSSARWDGHNVRMRYHGGDVDHIHANGVDHDSWMHSGPLIGHYKGHVLKEVIRGHNVLRFTTARRHVVRTVERGWSRGSSNHYLYRGRQVVGSLNEAGSYTQYAHCTAKRLTWTTKRGRVLAREVRVSRKP